MPKKRPPHETWIRNIRPIIWKRDGQKCIRCKREITLFECNIDHIKSGVKGTNKFSNLRTLCRRCHVLRADIRHRGMVNKALKDGIIPPNWRKLLWED